MKLQRARVWSLRIAWSLTIGTFALSMFSTRFILDDRETFETLFAVGAFLSWPLIISWVVVLVLHCAQG